ncbi:MAG TPA: hypothetical protein PKD85_19930, partial [Saprospiraceae bacterium]|nr:hypothetical protein [Saprospiraceae bacterium]
MELEEIKNIDRNIKAHQGQDIDFITKTPPWLLRSGMTLLFIVLVAVIVFTNFFKYPEKIVGSGIVTSDIPPISFLSNTTGYIEDILVPNE